MRIEKHFMIDPSHPSLAGHFPGNPIVPGVVILEEVLALIGESLDELVMLAKIPSVKFHSPLRPNESLQLTLDVLSDLEVTFSCRVDSRLVASGQFIFRRDGHSPASPS